MRRGPQRGDRGRAASRLRLRVVADRERMERVEARAKRAMVRRIWDRIVGSPPILLAYSAFAVGVTIVDELQYRFASEAFHKRLIPYSGWVASSFYDFSIVWALALVLHT